MIKTKTIIYDCMAFKDRDGGRYDSTKPYAGLSPALCSGQHFYAVKPNTGGARDLSKYSSQEAYNWGKSAPVGAPIVADIECMRDPDYREVHIDTQLSGTRAIEKDVGFMALVSRNIQAGALSENPIGLYGVLPGGFDRFNRVLLKDKQTLRRCQQSDNLVAEVLLPSVTALFPSLYTPTHDQVLWRNWATYMIQQSRRVIKNRGIKIIPFINPCRHPSSGGGFISLDFFEFQLRHLARLNVDGIIIWKGQDTPESWEQGVDYAALAAIVQKEFLK